MRACDLLCHAGPRVPTALPVFPANKREIPWFRESICDGRHIFSGGGSRGCVPWAGRTRSGPPAGKRLYGRAAVAEFTARVLSGATAHGHATYEVEHILFLRPDVAAVKVRQRYFTTAGDLDSEGTPMYVMTKEDGHWLLTANQNTPIVED
ncbi:SgcJ/EcaC family oxidoreductase [Nocardia sp. NPDC002869]|uniref:SgcJ/EcaC family oxidoreductase n=1 Tax=Nocardia sp. NPDC002869 TaxID=3161032 RepID=UPI00398CEBF7